MDAMVCTGVLKGRSDEMSSCQGEPRQPATHNFGGALTLSLARERQRNGTITDDGGLVGGAQHLIHSCCSHGYGVPLLCFPSSKRRLWRQQVVMK